MDRTTELISSYAVSLDYSDLPPATVQETKRRIIDSLGCAMGGFPSEPARIARRLASVTSSTFASRVLGSGDLTSPEMAAFANTVMVRYLDYTDTFVSPGAGHPSDMLPAVLAVADPCRASGKAVITATVLAYEIYGRFAEQVSSREKGWDQGVFTVIGSACAASKILGLSEKQTAHAISLAIVPNLPLNQTRVGELSMWKGCATAAATRNGVFAALLAREGMEGPYEPFDGRYGLWEQVTGPVQLEPLGGGQRPFKINETSVKHFPSQIHTQVPIEIALELRKKVNFEEIEAVNIETYRVAWRNAAGEPEKWDPKTRETADHSLPYVIAVAFKDGAINPSSFTPERIRDPRLRPLMQKVSVRENPEFTRQYPEAQVAQVELVTKSGERIVERARHPKGHWRNPLTEEELEAKFHSLAQTVLKPQQSRQVLEVLVKLEEVDDISPVLELFQV
ncbi:MAG: MmgE/PrpD family protein [Nitrospiraceae bacterium]